MKPLEGYTVVDLTTVVAASVCGRLLADLGARVIKIEAPKGDSWRNSGVSYVPDHFTQEANPIFDIYNSGKEMICLNLKTPEGMAIMHQLLQNADAFITNTRPAALKRLGLHYDDLKERYPGLVFGHLLGYGLQGPEADRPAYDVTAFWARSGFLRDTAPVTKDYQPVDAPKGVGDTVTGTNLAMQVLAALLMRERTGQGQYVRSSLYHMGLFTMGTMIVEAQRPFGVKRPMPVYNSRATGGAFECADGQWMFIGEDFKWMCKLGGKQELAEDPRFTPENLPANREAAHEIVRQIMLQKTSDEWDKIFKSYDTTSTRLGHFADAVEDEQAWANGYVEKVAYPNGNVDVVPASPLDMDCMERPKTQPTKRIGQDTAKVLEELGCTPEQIAQMAEAGIIRA